MTVVIRVPSACSERAIRNGSRSASERTSWRERQTHGSASTASRTAGHSAVGPETDRVVGGQAGLGRDRFDDGACLVVGRIERRVQRHGHDLRWRDEPGDPLVQLDERRQLRDRERGLGQVREVVLGEPRLVDEDHRVRRRAVDEPHRHGAVGGMVDRALALDDHPVAARLALLDEPLDRAVGEVADDPVDGHAPALDHHPGLAGRDHDRRGAVAPRRRDQLQGHRHLADRAVGADGQDHALARQVPAPDRRLHPVRRPPVVDQSGAGRRGRRGELRVVAQELVQPGVDVEAGARSPRGSSPASRRAAARRSGRCR